MFINLCNHSYYSLLMSSMSIDDIIQYALKNKQKYVCLTDFNVMYGAIEFYNKAIANNLKPIIGLNIIYNDIELYLIAKNNQGYKNLVKISSLVMSNKQFDINEYINDLYIITNDSDDFKFLKSKDNTFSFKDNKDNSIAAKPVYFETKDDFVLIKALKAIKNSVLLEELKDDNQYIDNYLISEVEAQKLYSKTALDNLNKLVSSCEWTIEQNKKNLIIKFDKDKDSRILLQSLCVNNLKQKFPADVPSEYLIRLRYELDVINKMEFNDYFLIVQDYVGFAKHQGILVGPGRGSAAGSLVSYLLNITTIDPIKHNLIFERFLNPQRVTMPDIDVDFMDERRNEVVEYLLDRYGQEHVAHIITFQRMKAKMSMRDAGRILGMSRGIIDGICKLLTDDFDQITDKNIQKELDQYQKDYPLLFKIAYKLQNLPRQTGLHAAGIVLSSLNLTDIVPIQDSSDGISSTQYSMEYLEPLGLIKMDILGLINLSVISQTIKLIQLNQGKTIDLYQISMNDQKVFRSIASGKTNGIFQLESSGMTDLIMKIKPTSIEDISICSALYRPGPQKNIPTYLANKKNPSQIKYLNDDIKSILSSTYNVIIYQEHVIQIVQKIAGFSLAQADLFRRAISKKNVEKLAQLKKNFIEGGIKNGYDEQTVNRIFDYIFSFANYGFNHSHSLAYSYISYWLAYLGYYYPIEFYTVLLINNNGITDKISEYINEAKSLGINIIPPNINLSDISFSIHNHKSIVIGFNIIKGIGSSLSSKLIAIRNKQKDKKFNSLYSCIKELKNNGISLKALETLVYAGILDEVEKQYSRYWIINNLSSIYDNVDNILPNGKCVTKININNDQPQPKDLEELNRKQFELTGLSFVEHPIIKIKKSYKGEINDLVSLNDLFKSNDNNYYHVMVLVNNVRRITDKNGRAMAFIGIEDETKSIGRMPIFWTSYAKLSSLLNEGNVLILTIKRDFRNPNTLIIVKGIEVK